MADARYIYADEHVHDVQENAAFLDIVDNWTARYDADSDVWHVTTPSGLARTYARIGAPRHGHR